MGVTVVALRKESVDRNINQEKNTRKTVLSLSARRAWIEIRGICQSSKLMFRRSPQGERG